MSHCLAVIQWPPGSASTDVVFGVNTVCTEADTEPAGVYTMNGRRLQPALLEHPLAARACWQFRCGDTTWASLLLWNATDTEGWCSVGTATTHPLSFVLVATAAARLVHLIRSVVSCSHVVSNRLLSGQLACCLAHCSSCTCHLLHLAIS
ncbi:hypothetical protein COO60DRAFT_326273 [Scenedesmus sp. NREL 46B-D3]|nr:hypothetical protein COO60DRAFT_326273 [Scenedesmus sp. NREL 46B-D3]